MEIEKGNSVFESTTNFEFAFDGLSVTLMMLKLWTTIKKNGEKNEIKENSSYSSW